MNVVFTKVDYSSHDALSLNLPQTGKAGRKIDLLFFFNFFSTFIYFWDRERQSMNGGGAEREGDTESETGSRL